MGWAEILSKPDMEDHHKKAIEWIGKWANAISLTLEDVKDYLEYRKNQPE
jgi:hypothetical protein